MPNLDDRERDELGRLLPSRAPVPEDSSPEARLDAICLRYRLLLHEIDRIPDPHDNAEAHLLALQIAAEKEAARERNRQQLLATVPARLAKMHATRRNAMAERMAKHREAQVARVRRALAETHGRRAAAMRKLDMGRNAFDKYYKIIQEEEREKPVPRCVLCGGELPSLDTPEKP